MLAILRGRNAGNTEAPPGDRGVNVELRRSDGGTWRVADASLTNLPAKPALPKTTVDELVAQLDAAGIRRLRGVVGVSFSAVTVNRQTNVRSAK